MVTGGIVDYDAPARTYFLRPARAACLTEGPTNLAPMALLGTHLGKHVHQVARAFREGGGVPYAEYRPEFTDVMDGLSRVTYDAWLVDGYLPLAPGLVARLERGARVADVACGTGHAIVLLARAFPASTFVGYDLDEGAIAHNVLTRDIWHLFGPIDFGQIAPPGFLLIVKAGTAAFGSSEYALRLLPLAAALASLVFFSRVCRRVLQPISAAVALLLFAVAMPLVFFGANLKQYSSDVAVTLLVIGVTLRQTTALTRARAWRLAAFGLLALLVSQASLFALTAAGALLVVDGFGARRPDRWSRILVAAAWAAGVLAAVAYVGWVMTDVTRAYVARFWAGLFMPSEGTIRWLGATLLQTFGGSQPAFRDQ